MVGSLINAFASMHKARKADEEERSYLKEIQSLDKQRPGYWGALASKEIVNPLYDSNINMYAQGAKSNLLPGQAYMQSRIDNNSSNALSSAARSGVTGSQLTSVLSGALAGNRQATTDLSIDGAQYRQDQQNHLADANMEKAGVQADQYDKEFNQNVWQPYVTLQNRANMLWTDAANRKNQWKAQQQQSGAQAAQDVGNFWKSKYGGSGDTQQPGNFRGSDRGSGSGGYANEPVRARGQGTSMSWQKRGRGF